MTVVARMREASFSGRKAVDVYREGRSKYCCTQRGDLRRVAAVETKKQEGVRLQARTKALQKEHQDMVSPPRSAAQMAEHEQHRANLVRHSSDLAKHRRRKAD